MSISGDGDSPSYKNDVEAKPYAGYFIDPVKCEYVGHVLKLLLTSSYIKVFPNSRKNTIILCQTGLVLQFVKILLTIKWCLSAPLVSTWCKYQKNKLTGKTTHTNNISIQWGYYKANISFFSNVDLCKVFASEDPSSK